MAPDYFPSGDRSSCDGRFFLKANRYELSLYEYAQTSSQQVDSVRKYAGCATTEAIVILARKLLRIAFAIWTSGIPFNPDEVGKRACQKP
jgi:hypothetical protein